MELDLLTQERFDQLKSELIKIHQDDAGDHSLYHQGLQVYNVYLDYDMDDNGEVKALTHHWYNKQFLDKHNIKY